MQLFACFRTFRRGRLKSPTHTNFTKFPDYPESTNQLSRNNRNINEHRQYRSVNYSQTSALHVALYFFSHVSAWLPKITNPHNLHQVIDYPEPTSQLSRNNRNINECRQYHSVLAISYIQPHLSIQSPKSTNNPTINNHHFSIYPTFTSFNQPISIKYDNNVTVPPSPPQSRTTPSLTSPTSPKAGLPSLPFRPIILVNYKAN